MLFAMLAPPRQTSPTQGYDSSIAQRQRCSSETVERAKVLASSKKWGDAILLLDGCIGPYEAQTVRELRDSFRVDREIDWLEANPKGAWDTRLSGLRTIRNYAPTRLTKAQEAELQRLEKRDDAEREKAAKQAAADERARRRKEGVSIGMTKEEVLMSNWGKPERVNTDIYRHGVREQWVYGGGYLYFRDGVLESIQTRGR